MFDLIKYKYLLPFRLKFGEDSIDTYSLLAQKQAGSVGGEFISEINFPKEYEVKWKYPEEISADDGILRMETDLKTNKFIGVAFQLGSEVSK